MTEAEKPTLEQILAKLSSTLSVHARLNEGIEEPFISNREKVPVFELSIYEVRLLSEASRKYAAIEKAVKVGTHALLPTQPTEAMISSATFATNSGLGRPIPIYKAMVKEHGTDPLIDGGEQNGH